MAVIIGGVDPRSAYQGDVSEISDSIAITDNRSPMWPSLYDPRDKHNSLVVARSSLARTECTNLNVI